MTSPPLLLLTMAAALLAAAALLSLVPGRWQALVRASRWSLTLGALASAVAGAWLIQAGQVIRWSISGTLPGITWSLQLDPLAGFFLLVISLPTVAASVYAGGYFTGTAHAAEGRSFVSLTALFVLSLLGVVLANDVYSFFFAWELMALLSFLLVLIDRHQEQRGRAGFVYLVMTHGGAAFVLLGLLLLGAHTGSLSFSAFRTLGPGLDPGLKSWLFVLFLIGFGSKAGLMPLHVWLPRAHPVAPAPASALLSGAMVKLGVYGLFRVAFEFLGADQAWWGQALLVVGGASAVIGVIQALVQSDLKRLLAYSSIENIGIITLGLGASLVFQANQLPALAALAAAGALFHVLNHSLFKALLFLGAGAVVRSTGTPNLELLGGLWRRLGWIGAWFALGTVAIAALPPLNGFASEWMLYQALIGGISQLSAPEGALLVAVLGGLALTGALAAVTFVKALATSFLGAPRSPAAAQAAPVPASLSWGMGGLALGCVVLGLFPSLVLAPLSRLLTPLFGAAPGLSLGLAGVQPALRAGLGSLSPLALVLVLSAAGALAYVLALLLQAPAGRRVVAPWTCGVRHTPVMSYSAGSFAQPLRQVFQAVLRPSGTVLAEAGGRRYVLRTGELFETYLYRPALALVLAAANRVRHVQAGSIHLYLAYILGALVLLLLLRR